MAESLDLDCNMKPIYLNDDVVVVKVFNNDPEAQACLGKLCKITGVSNSVFGLQLVTNLPCYLGGFYMGAGFVFQKIGDDTTPVEETDRLLEEA